MYVPKHFAEHDPVVIRQLLDQHPFATVVAQSAHGLDAEHIPLVSDWDDDGNLILSGHIARGNPLVALDGSTVLTIFQGEDSYISPNWYPTKKETHRHVPTWNYQAVHVSGTLEVVYEPKFLLNVIGRLTKIHEQCIGVAQPWKMSDAPRDYLDELLQHIVGIRIVATQIQAKSKISQNRAPVDFSGVQDQMRQRGKLELYEAMEHWRLSQTS